MSTTDSLDALRRANPRGDEEFAAFVDAGMEAVRSRVDTDHGPARIPAWSRRRRILPALAAAVVVAGVGAFALSTVGSHGTEDAFAAVRNAARVTAASAKHSGTVSVTMTHDGQAWAGKTIRWNGEDVAIVDDPSEARPRAGVMLVVHNTLYGIDPRDGRWIDLGPPSSIDPGSGTTPTEQLAAVREDVGGPTLRRILGGITGLTTEAGPGGATVYRGQVPAGLIAREQGFKEGQTIRVLPFGYVAHDQAADPANPLDVAVTVADGVVRRLAVSWGTWTYTVDYRGLGSTPAPQAPKNARSLLKERGLG